MDANSAWIAFFGLVAAVVMFCIFVANLFDYLTHKPRAPR